ncbi:hypothetical protein BM607_004510 [Shewanella sp. SACH]|nr:hypothetical protein [Shewanella sp. SACH]OUS53193.1 hypothetical protein BM607_004510 [Shewanella sp. SACH]
MSAGFIGSAGKAFASKIPSQRQLTDTQLSLNQQYLLLNLRNLIHS